MSVCSGPPAEDDLERYLKGSLPELQARSFEEHFFECPDCLAKLEALEAVTLKLAAEPAARPRKLRPKTPVLWPYYVAEAIAATIVLGLLAFGAIPLDAASARIRRGFQYEAYVGIGAEAAHRHVLLRLRTPRCHRLKPATCVEAAPTVNSPPACRRTQSMIAHPRFPRWRGFHAETLTTALPSSMPGCASCSSSSGYRLPTRSRVSPTKATHRNRKPRFTTWRRRRCRAITSPRPNRTWFEQSCCTATLSVARLLN